MSTGPRGPRRLIDSPIGLSMRFAVPAARPGVRAQVAAITRLRARLAASGGDGSRADLEPLARSWMRRARAYAITGRPVTSDVDLDARRPMALSPALAAILDAHRRDRQGLAEGVLAASPRGRRILAQRRVRDASGGDSSLAIDPAEMRRALLRGAEQARTLARYERQGRAEGWWWS